jgi:hypothetical protein
VDRRGQAIGMRDGYLRGAFSRPATPLQIDVLAASAAAAGSGPDAAALVGIRPSTTKRHLADLRARTRLATVELIYAGRADGWLMVPSLESHGAVVLVVLDHLVIGHGACVSPRDRAARSTARPAAARRSG